MKKEPGIKFFVDPIGNTLCMWIGDPQSEVVSDMDEQDNILMYGKKNKLIGFEKINFLPEPIFKQLKKTLAGKSVQQLKGGLNAA